MILQSALIDVSFTVCKDASQNINVLRFMYMLNGIEPKKSQVIVILTIFLERWRRVGRHCVRSSNNDSLDRDRETDLKCDVRFNCEITIFRPRWRQWGKSIALLTLDWCMCTIQKQVSGVTVMCQHSWITSFEKAETSTAFSRQRFPTRVHWLEERKQPILG